MGASRIAVTGSVAVAILAGAMVGAGGLAGCQSKREKARDEMVGQAETFRETLNRIPPQLDEVGRRLSAASSGQNPRRAGDVREFSKSLETLREQGRVVAS